MRRASPIILILAAVLGLAWVCAEAEAAPLRHPIKLGAKCQKSFEKFLNWPAYYKTFAYVVGRRGYACAMNEGRRAALEACNRQNKGRCEVYAQSPVDGGLKILWPARAKPRIRDDKGPSTRVGPCYEGPGTTISRLTARECRRRDGVIVERREHIRLCQRKRLQPAQCLELLEQNRPDGVRPRTAARDQRRPPDNGSIVVRNLPSKDAAAKAVRVREAAQASAAEKARQANLDKALTALRKQHKHAVAVIVGNRDYAGRTPDVAYAGNDAKAMRDFVINRLGYRPGNVIDLRDATLSELNATFGTANSHKGRLFDYVRAGKSDVIVFYSGHGVPGQNDRKGYLLPVDADPNRAELNGYPLDTLLGNLAKVPARSMAVYLDACFSGESEKGTLVRATSGLTVQRRLPKSSTGMVVVTAAQNDQFASWDEDAKHGLFTKHLLEALRGRADGKGFGNGDGKVSLAELKSYLDEEMTYQARRRWSRDQNASVKGDLSTQLSIIR